MFHNNPKNLHDITNNEFSTWKKLFRNIDDKETNFDQPY
jgi:hypothetical protein